jgi:enediyne biosynthesis protein E4
MIAQKFPTYLSFAQSDLSGILGEEQLKTALHYQAQLFSTVLFVNESGSFKATKLPRAAQLSTVNGIIVKDFDADGKKDILLAGNKFDVEVETTPADASPGLFLKGIGSLTFKPCNPKESGFFVPYNVKDIQSITIADRWGILVSSNNDQLRIFSKFQ